MRDARLVRLGETTGDLSGKAQNLLGRERTVDNQLSKGLALDELHHNESCAFILPDVVDGCDVGMVQGGGGPSFPLESTAPLGVRGKLGRQHLDGDGTVESSVLRLVDLARYSQIVFETQRHKKHFSTGVRKVQLPVEKWKRRTMASF